MIIFKLIMSIILLIASIMCLAYLIFSHYYEWWFLGLMISGFLIGLTLSIGLITSVALELECI